MPSDVRNYLSKKNFVNQRANYIKDKSEQTYIIKSTLEWNSNVEGRMPVQLRSFEIKNSKMCEQFYSGFFKAPLKFEGSRVWEYFDCLHLKVFWRMQAGDVELCKHIWNEGWGIIIQYENTPPGLLLQLKHRSAFGTLLHVIFNETFAEENIKAARKLLGDLKKHEHRDDLMQWGQWSDAKYRKNLDIERIKVSESYIQFYSCVKYDFEQVIHHSLAQLGLIIHNNLYGKFFVQWLIHAQDVSAHCLQQLTEQSTSHHFLLSSYMLRAAIAFIRKYENNRKVQKYFSKEDLHQIEGATNIAYVYHLIRLNSFYKKSLNLPQNDRLPTFKDLHVPREPQHEELPQSEKDVLENFKYACEQLRKAKLLIPAPNSMLALAETHLRSARCQYKFLNDVVIG